MVASKFWQLWIKLLKIAYAGFLCGHKFSNPLSKYQKVWLLDHIVWICLVVQETTKLLTKVAVPFFISTSSEREGSVVLHLGQDVAVSGFWTFDVLLKGLRWYFIISLISIMLMKWGVEHLFVCLFSMYISYLARDRLRCVCLSFKSGICFLIIEFNFLFEFLNV